MNEEMVLVECEDEYVHPDVFVAESPDTSPVALFHLTAHAERTVRLALAARRDLPAKAYERLLNDSDPEVAQVAATRGPRRKRISPTT